MITDIKKVSAITLITDGGRGKVIFYESSAEESFNEMDRIQNLIDNFWEDMTSFMSSEAIQPVVDL